MHLSDPRRSRSILSKYAWYIAFFDSYELFQLLSFFYLLQTDFGSPELFNIGILYRAEENVPTPFTLDTYNKRFAVVMQAQLQYAEICTQQLYSLCDKVTDSVVVLLAVVANTKPEGQN
jgi:hypothetical protein